VTNQQEEGKRIKTSAIKDYAIKNNLLTLQPENLKDPEFINQLQELNADLFVVIAFRMLPEVVWGMPKKGTINLHASLLPQYRGAAPINWAIINGEKESGVTTFFIEKEIDTGKIIEQLKLEIGPNTNVGDLYSQLIVLGKKIIGSTVDKISSNNFISIDQKSIINGEIKNAPKIFKKDCIINWNETITKYSQ
jgi:Methionyl-tRNA formyltransferase